MTLRIGAHLRRKEYFFSRYIALSKRLADFSLVAVTIWAGLQPPALRQNMMAAYTTHSKRLVSQLSTTWVMKIRTPSAIDAAADDDQRQV